MIGYASHTLTPAEQKYNFHLGKLEFLALKWAICDYFCDYLCHVSDFTVFTECNPLTYVLSTSKLNAIGLADFHFSIKHMPGDKNKVADLLSRMPLDRIRQECTEETTLETVDAIMQGITVNCHDTSCFIDSLKIHSNHQLPDQHFNGTNLPNSISRFNLIRAQEDHQIIGIVFQLVIDGNKPSPTYCQQTT